MNWWFLIPPEERIPSLRKTITRIPQPLPSFVQSTREQGGNGLNKLSANARNDNVETDKEERRRKACLLLKQQFSIVHQETSLCRENKRRVSTKKERKKIWHKSFLGKEALYLRSSLLVRTLTQSRSLLQYWFTYRISCVLHTYIHTTNQDSTPAKGLSKSSESTKHKQLQQTGCNRHKELEKEKIRQGATQEEEGGTDVRWI